MQLLREKITKLENKPMITGAHQQEEGQEHIKVCLLYTSIPGPGAGRRDGPGAGAVFGESGVLRNR